MRISRSLAVTALVLAFLSANWNPNSAERRTQALADEDDSEITLEDTFVYDVVTRFNMGLIANVDAIDTAVTAVLAGNVAIVVFAIDNIRKIRHAEECLTIGLLSGSLLACVFAYLIGSQLGATRRDGVLPRFFVPDLIERQRAAITTAVENVILAGEINLYVRWWKRTLVVIAIFLLLAGAVVIAFARLGANVVE